jgi:hypothetical protein
MMTPIQGEAIRSVIGLLAIGEYEALATMTGSQRLTASMLRTAVEEYGRTLVIPPGGLPSDLAEIPESSNPGTSHFVMSLWTAEEGLSDLSIELTLVENDLGFIATMIDDIRVL